MKPFPSRITLHFAFEQILIKALKPSSITKEFKHMSKATPNDPSWNKKMTTSVHTNMMHIQSAPHQGFPLGSPGRVLSCTVVAGSRHDTLTVIGATFNPLSRRWELESLPKQKRLLVSNVKGIHGLKNASWNTVKKIMFFASNYCM